MPRSDASASLPCRVEPREVKCGAAGRFPFELRATPLPWCDDLPDEQAEQSGDGRDRTPCRPSFSRRGTSYAGTMKTGVPTSTWSNSHSACGMYIRMQPCEAE